MCFFCVKDMEYNIRIANVREVPPGISLSRWEIMRYHGGEISVSLRSKFLPGRQEGIVTLLLTTAYTYMRDMMRHRLLDYSVAVDFEIDHYDKLSIEEAGMDLPPRLMALMYAAAIGSLRGMLALRTANTFLKDYPLPLINVSALVCSHRTGRPVPDNIVPLTDLYYN